jgi:hypothetical protein
MLALLHILNIKSDFISNYIKLFSSEKIHAKIDTQNITSCNLLLVGIQQYGLVYLNKSYTKSCVYKTMKMPFPTI